MRLLRPDEEKNGTARSSAVWTKPGGTRSSALWGKGGRGFAAVVVLALALLLPSTALADGGDEYEAFVPADLITRAEAHPRRTFDVIVQGEPGRTSARMARRVQDANGVVFRKFRSVVGVSARLRGARLLDLAERSDVFAITLDARLSSAYEDAEMWRQSTHVDLLWSVLDPLTGLELAAPQAPAIAVVDSGVDATNLASFGTRVIGSVNLSSLPDGDGDLLDDDQGHGTMVAGVAAGADPLIPGAAQNAPIVSIRTSDKDGQSKTSDVIAAADWILANHKQYGIRVANFSLKGSVETSFRVDPLDKAVERLWFNDIVVVAAAGNHGAEDGSRVSMSYAPANDPFVITVGALDQAQTSDAYDDTTPWWSGYGYTMDGVAKPDLAAPGRYMIMPVPVDATIPNTVPERVLAPGYMWMSGTSFAAPVVAGAAAQMLARHPEWGADEVKGALMLTSLYLHENGSSGVGLIDAAAAASLEGTPPNPNENYYAFVETDPETGRPFFNEAAWSSHVESLTASGAAWSSAAWSSAAWSSAAWSSAAWSSAAWSSAAWSSAAWSSDVESSMTSTANWNASANAE